MSTSTDPQVTAAASEQADGSGPQIQNPKKEQRASKEPKPLRPLPTNRVAFQKQLEIIRAFGAISGPDRKAVSNVDVSKVVNLHPSTVGLVVPFLTECGFLTKASDGLVPAEEVTSFAAAHDWGPDVAFHRCAPIATRTWMFTALEAKLRFSPLGRHVAITELSVVSAAGPTFRTHLEMAIEFLVTAGVVVADGDQLRLPRAGSEQKQAQHEPSKDHSSPPQGKPKSDVNDAGALKFNIGINVDMAELATWSPERITAFFSGMAQVIAAKAKMEA